MILRKKTAIFFGLIFSFGLGSLANAAVATEDFEAPNRLIYEGVDISPIVEYLQREVLTLKRPLTFYSWSNAGYVIDAGKTGIAQNGALTFWKIYGLPANTNNMYGAGLYLAADPIISSEYGKSDDWLLSEVRLPSGFRFVDVGSLKLPLQSQARADFQKAVVHFDCSDSISMEDVFGSGGTRIKSRCRALMKTIFKDILRIDGFAYMYGHFNFKACAGNPEDQRAFVVTNPYWMTSATVQYYTAHTKNRTADRIRIQSLILKTEPADPIGDEALIVPSPYITKAEALTSIRRKLLWKDLEGQMKTPDLDKWMHENMYYCSGQQPY